MIPAFLWSGSRSPGPEVQPVGRRGGLSLQEENARGAQLTVEIQQMVSGQQVHREQCKVQYGSGS